MSSLYDFLSFLSMAIRSSQTDLYIWVRSVALNGQWEEAWSKIENVAQLKQQQEYHRFAGVGVKNELTCNLFRLWHPVRYNR